MSTVKNPEVMSDKEVARELFAAGYYQALDDVAKALCIPKDCGFLQKLRSRVALVKARAAISKATGAKK